ncbi:MAG: type II secretion system protein [Magnetococcales bacterium]|nr:type II secretion system protein [Magnetococcales bacterium]
MPSKRKAGGFSLIELIFFIVISGITLVGIVPLYTTVLTNLHVHSDIVQAEYLGWEMAETLQSAYNKGDGFLDLTEAKFPTQTGIDLGGTLKFDRLVEVEGMIPGRLPNPCTGQEYAGEPYKCLTVIVKQAGTNQELFRVRMINSDIKNTLGIAP